MANKYKLDFGPGDAILIKGLNEIRKNDAMQEVINGQVQRIANRAGNGFVGDVRVGRTRCQGVVKTTDADSLHDAFKSHALSKAIG